VGVRVPLLESKGSHTFYNPQPSWNFDIHGFMDTLTAVFFATLDPRYPAEPHTLALPDLDPVTRRTKHRVEERTCAQCETTSPMKGCGTLRLCDLEGACKALGIAMPFAADVTVKLACE